MYPCQIIWRMSPWPVDIIQLTQVSSFLEWIKLLLKPSLLVCLSVKILVNKHNLRLIPVEERHNFVLFAADACHGHYLDASM